MVKAELSYNPYLRETKVRFNGQNPKINSLVEKYQSGRLQAWVKQVPSVFFDEMNGFDFELDFSGTKVDFEDVTNAFVELGVSDEQVRISLKNELESSLVKSKRIQELLAWLKKNPNRKFDNKRFKATNRELFDESYSYILVRGSNIEVALFDRIKVSVENVESTEELNNTELVNTPVLFYLDELTIRDFRKNLNLLLNREDVANEQLFFLVHPAINSAQVERTIKDNGVLYPYIVTSIEDEAIKRFFEIYPVTSFVRHAIKAFNTEINEIGNLLAEENEQSKIANSETLDYIGELESNLTRLKNAKEMYEQRENQDFSIDLENAKSELIYRITNWRINKTKITKDEEAVRISKEFDAELKQYFGYYLSLLQDAFVKEGERIERTFREWYQTAEFEANFRAENVSLPVFNEYDIASIDTILLGLKEESYSQPKNDLLDVFFGQPDTEPIGLVKVVVYSYQEWRVHAVEKVLPVSERAIEERVSAICKYSDEVANTYIEHLDELIERQIEERENAAAQLSENEKKLQIDNDWLASFKEQVKVIEKG
jgi:hypothetical protein